MGIFGPMPSVPDRLAVVLPAFRGDYLDQALDSLARQDRRVPVHVFDDASPEDLEAIVDRHRERLDLRFHRFESNLGGEDLSAHWNRCIEETRSDFVWLFSDDDIADPGCAGAALEAIASHTDQDVFAFQSRVIGPDGVILRENPRLPELESCLDFLRLRLEGFRESFVPDHVFRRATWKEIGGFPSYPLAWFADDAFWLGMSRRSGIRALPATVSWRRSGRNLSSFHTGLCRAKYRAQCQFDAMLERDGWWTSLQIAEGSPRDTTSLRTSWFWRSFQAIGYPFPPREWPSLRAELASGFPEGRTRVSFRFLRAWLHRLTHPVV